MRFFRSEQQWAGRVVDRERPMSGARLPDQQQSRRWPVGEAQCTAPQAESDVIVLATTVNGFSGSRRSSRGAGTNVASGITGVDGLSKTGRLLGAQAAAWVWGGAVVKGGASGV